MRSALASRALISNLHAVARRYSADLGKMTALKLRIIFTEQGRCLSRIAGLVPFLPFYGSVGRPFDWFSALSVLVALGVPQT